MVRYPSKRVEGFITRFRTLSKVSLWRIAGFHRIRFLRMNCGLAEKETKFLDDVLDDSCESIRRAMGDIMDFYEANYILHVKFRHGLLSMPGLLFSHRSDHQVPDSFFLAFDKSDKRPAKLCFEGRPIYPSGLEWFNTYSILPYWDSTLKRYNEILGEIKRLSEHILRNHLLYAFNCGEDYLPAKRLPTGETIVEVYSTKKPAEEERRQFQEICRKVRENLYVPELKLNVVFNISFEKIGRILECFADHQSATIWKISPRHNSHQQIHKLNKNLLED